jgi:hypothetical protein
MSQTLNTPLASNVPASAFFGEMINKISNLITIIQESSAEAQVQYKKHSILGGGWE